MRKFLSVLSVTIAVAAGLAMLAAPASADGVWPVGDSGYDPADGPYPVAATVGATSTTESDDPIIMPGCPGRTVEAIGEINIRARARVNSAHLGVAEEGDRFPCRITNITGGSYTACGVTSNQWIQVEYQGGPAYLAQECTRLLG